MRFSEDAAKRICRATLSRWTAKGLIRKDGTDEALVSKMAAALMADVAKEEALDREVEALLDKHARELDATQANSRLLFQKIKTRLADERGMVVGALQQSDDRRGHWARLQIARLKKEALAAFADESAVQREARAVLDAWAKAADEADRTARAKIAGQSRRVPEGGREWDILYRKYFEEEMARRNL
ncbi:MAG TPA: DUF507 family protein [Candidatus Deferrimicrobiaceae bacterium]